MVGIKDFNMPSCCNSCSHWSFNRDDEPLCDLTYEYISQFDKRQADCPLTEAYTKTDMVAMLEELDLQIDESAAYSREVAKVQRLIRDKINTLKETGNATNRC